MKKIFSYKGGLNKSLENIIFNFLNIINLYIDKARDKNKTLIIKYLKEKGYISCDSNIFCMKSIVNTYYNMSSSDVNDSKFNSIKILSGKNNENHLYAFITISGQAIKSIENF